MSKSDDKQHVQGADCHDVADRHWINGNLPCDGEMLPIANPMLLGCTDVPARLAVEQSPMLKHIWGSVIPVHGVVLIAQQKPQRWGTSMYF